MIDVIKKLTILGSTGSIGRSCLDVVRAFPDRFRVRALAGGRNIDLLAQQVESFRPEIAVVLGPAEAEELRQRVDPRVRILWGEEGYNQVAGDPEVDVVLSAIVGAAGLVPTLTAVRAGKQVALANKETLVVAGELVMAEAEAAGANILPVDSEHSAIFQSLAGQRPQDVRRIILTASGGPFRDWTAEELSRADRETALAHPNWSMGAKITVDSATLMNKGLEAIEARWLFNLPFEKIAIHIHPQSIVHSMVEFVDGSVLAQLGRPDMRAPIAYALSYPERLPLDLPRLNLTQSPDLTFAEPDPVRFPCLPLALKAGRLGGTAPAVLNAANETAVSAFLDGRLTFAQIYQVTAETLEALPLAPTNGLAGILEADRAARSAAEKLISDLGDGRR